MVESGTAAQQKTEITASVLGQGTSKIKHYPEVSESKDRDEKGEFLRE